MGTLKVIRVRFGLECKGHGGFPDLRGLGFIGFRVQGLGSSIYILGWDVPLVF